MILSPQQQRVYHMMLEASETGARCLSNEEFARVVGYAGAPGASAAINGLCKRGLLRRLSNGPMREFQVVANGKKIRQSPTANASHPMTDILATVARCAAMSEAEITGHQYRARIYMRARVVFCHLAHEDGWGYAAIGRFLGRDHSTIMYACGQVEPYMRHDRLFARLLRRTTEAMAGLDRDTIKVEPRRHVPPSRPALRPVPLNTDDLREVTEREKVLRGSESLLRAIRAAYPGRAAA